MITFGKQISVEEYNELRNAVGWLMVKPERAQKGIHNSVCFVASDGNRPVGLARLITDGGYVSAIYDVIVHPDYQRKGIGTSLMNQVMNYIRNDLEEGEDQVICLFAAKGKEPFYKKFGFEERPNEKAGAGMSQWFKKAN